MAGRSPADGRSGRDRGHDEEARRWHASHGPHGCRPDRIEEYEREHAAVWPSVLAVIKAAGVRDYSIFRPEDRVFGVYECDDPEAANA